MSSKKPYPNDMPCPCGSEKIYKKCCKKTKVKYFIDGDKIIKEIPMFKETQEMLNDELEKFKELYGRYPKNEPIMAFAPVFANEVILQITYALRHNGISEDYIYAYYRTNGLFPCNSNKKIMSDIDIKEFEKFRQEYKKLFTAEIHDSINVLQFVQFMNPVIEEHSDYIIESIIMVLNDFIRRHGEDYDITEYKLTTEIDYYLFSAIKTIKTLNSIQRLKDVHMTECIYALGRSLFENYMYLCNINKNEHFFNDKLLPKVDNDNYTFVIKANGQIDYTKIIKNHDNTIQNVHIKLSDLKKHLEYNEDLDIYNIFYQTACQYVHVDVLSAKNYFSIIDPYEELDPSLIAYSIVATLAVMLVSQFGKYRNTQEQYRKDIEYLCKNVLKDKVISGLLIGNQIPEQKNDILDLLKKRIESEFN